MEVREPHAKYVTRAEYAAIDASTGSDGWTISTMDELLGSTQLGGNYKNSERESDWPLVKMGNLGRGRIALDKLEYIDPESTPNERDRLHRGDVLLNTRNTLDLVGKVAIWRGELPQAYFNSNIMRLTFDAVRVSDPFLMGHVLNTAQSIAGLRAMATGTTSVAAIYTRDLLQLEVLVPPHRKQRDIRETLEAAEALIESLEQLLAKKRQLKQGAMQELLSGKKRLPGFSAPWQGKVFSELAQPRRERITPQPGFECVDLENIEPATGHLLGMTETSEASSLKTIFRRGDVLFGKLRAYLRKHWFATHDGMCSTEFWALAPNRAITSGSFVFQLVKTDRFIEAASSAYGTHMPRSDWSVVKNFEVSCPQPEEQAAIATLLSTLDAELEALEARLTKARQLKQGMAQALLTGRIRLPTGA